MRGKGRSAGMPPEKTTALETKIEVVRVQLDALGRNLTDFIGESRRWREELKSDTNDRVARLETQTLEGARAVVERIERIEKNAVAAEAVDKYRRWLFGTAALAAAGLLFNAFSLARSSGLVGR